VLIELIVSSNMNVKTKFHKLKLKTRWVVFWRIQWNDIFLEKSTCCRVRIWYNQNKLADIREWVYSRYMGKVSYNYVVY